MDCPGFTRIHACRMRAVCPNNFVRGVDRRGTLNTHLRTIQSKRWLDSDFNVSERMRSIVLSAAGRSCALFYSEGGSEAGNVEEHSFLKACRSVVPLARKMITIITTRTRLFTETQEFRVASQLLQFLASLVYVGLYVWGTYSQPVKGSIRYFLELALCFLFAWEFMYRFFTNHPDPGSKLRMITAPTNIFDLLSFAPTLLELVLQQVSPSFSLGRLDLRWVKLLRSLRVVRVGLLAAELRSLHLSTKHGSWLAAGASWRLIQLAVSPIVLLFTSAAIIQIVERVPFHKSVYFVATTLSTVGFGDVVATTFLGKACVVAMIAVGIVLIPVQAATFYNELAARRVVRGSLPDWRGKPFILLSTRLTEVRAFSDLFAEFQQALGTTALFPLGTKVVTLCNRPSFEFSAFQEMHERALTFVEGSAVSGKDLVTVRAERARAIILLADRFTSDPEYEDLGILFQVWAAKSYTKTVPIFVQTLKQATLQQIMPFLDPGQDVAVSTEETRFRLLALSACCPGASTLIGNLIRSSSVRPREARDEYLADRKWLRQYVDGCEATLCTAPVQRHLIGYEFNLVTEWLFRISGHAIIGLIDSNGHVVLNPNNWKLEMGYKLLVIGTGNTNVRKSLAETYLPLSKRSKDMIGKLVPHEYPNVPCKNDTGHTKDAFFGDAEEECVPIYYGIPESESVDMSDDNMPCIPKNQADNLKSLDNLRLFYSEYRKDLEAREEQAMYGRLSNWTSRRLAARAGLKDNLSLPSNSEGKKQDVGAVSLQGHYIICGHAGSFLQFMQYLRAADPSKDTIIVVLAPERPSDLEIAKQLFGPIVFVKGSPTHAHSLRQAGAATARALVFLTKGSRDVKSAQATGGTVEAVRNTREAVLADASALLSCYGVGEESGATLTHAVVELLFTTSIEFLQPGLLLKGVNSMYDEKSVPRGLPRQSWSMRALQQREAVSEGLAEWQANPYYAAGRCTVPALMDTFATQGFFTRGMLIEVLRELSGDIREGEPLSDPKYAPGELTNDTQDQECVAAMLIQLPLPTTMVGKTFGECFSALVLTQGIIPIGLYRKKLENPATRLSYVMTLPTFDEKLQLTDRLFVIRNRSTS